MIQGLVIFKFLRSRNGNIIWQGARPNFSANYVHLHPEEDKMTLRNRLAFKHSFLLRRDWDSGSGRRWLRWWPQCLEPAWADSLGSGPTFLLIWFQPGRHHGPLHQKVTPSSSQGRYSLDMGSMYPKATLSAMVSDHLLCQGEFPQQEVLRKSLKHTPKVNCGNILTHHHVIWFNGLWMRKGLNL